MAYQSANAPQIRSAIIDENTKLPPDIAEALAAESDAPESPEST